MFHQIPLFLNLGTPEMILIMFVALLLFGGKKLPELARGLGKGLRDFKEASEGLKTEINNQINQVEVAKTEVVASIDNSLAENTPAAAEVNSDHHNPEIAYEHHNYENQNYENQNYENQTYENQTYENHGGHTGTIYEEPVQPAQPVVTKAKTSKKKLKTEKS
jgi:sec-independent protein translocase protein TatA